MPPGPKKRRARKQQQQKQQQQQQHQQQIDEKRKKNEEPRQEEEEDDEDEEIPSPERQLQKLLLPQEVVKEEVSAMADGDANLSSQPEETMEACKNFSVDEAKKHENLSLRVKETVEVENNVDVEDAVKSDHKEEEGEAEDAVGTRDIDDAESKVFSEVLVVSKLEAELEQEVSVVSLLEAEAEVVSKTELVVVAKPDVVSQWEAVAVSEPEIVVVFEPEVVAVSESEIVADSKTEAEAATEPKPEAEVVFEATAEAVVVSEPEVVMVLQSEAGVVSKPETVMVSELDAVVVSKPEAVDLVPVDVDSEVEIKRRPCSEIGSIIIAPVDSDLQKELNPTAIQTVNLVDVEPQLDSEASIESRLLPDVYGVAKVEEITKVENSNQEKTEQLCEPDQQDDTANDDLLGKQIEEELKLNQASEEDTSEVSMIEKHAEIPTKAEEETTTSPFSVIKESSEISSYVQEILSSAIEFKSFPFENQEDWGKDRAREEEVVSHLHHVEKEDEPKASSSLDEVNTLSVVEDRISGNVMESEDGFVDEPSMSEQDREDDAASSLIVEVGSVYTDSDLQELEDSGNPPVGIEEGHFDSQDYISRAESLDVDGMCLEEQDNGENPNVEHEHFNEEKAGFPQEKIELVEAMETIVEDFHKPNVTDDIVVYTTDDSITVNLHESSPIHASDSCKLEDTNYTTSENEDHKDDQNLKNGHSSNGVCDAVDADFALDNANRAVRELEDKKEILATMQNEEEVKIEVKETNIYIGKWKQAAILPEESIEAWDEKSEIVNIVTPIISCDHSLPTRSLQGGEDASGEKASIEFSKEESLPTVVPNQKERSIEYANEKKPLQADRVEMVAQRSNWFGCCGILDLLMSKDR